MIAARNPVITLAQYWVPILFAATMVLLMWTWIRGTRHVQAAARRGATTVEALIDMLAKSSRLKDVPGTAVFLTSDPDIAPAALMHNIKHNHVLHERNIIVCVSVTTRPFVPDAERIRITKLSDRFSRVDRIFDAALDLPPDQQTAFIARECGDDDALRVEVLELVRAYHQADSLLDAPAARMAAPLLDAAAALAGPVPERIGAFRVVR